MAATNRYRNVSVAWTPLGGTQTPLTGIKSANYDEGNAILEESADYDAFMTVGGVIMGNPKITIDSIDAFLIYATVAGQKDTLAVTFRDHLNGATAAGGAKLVTMSNAFLGQRTIQGQYNQLAHQSLTFHSTSTDGSSHPVSISSV
jgi:hypothetical protein